MAVSSKPLIFALLTACNGGPIMSPSDVDSAAKDAAEGGALADAGAEVGAPDAPADGAMGDLLSKLAQCNELTTGRYKAKAGAQWPANIPVCGLKNAVFFQADMDIDCDGAQSSTCNASTDPAYQPQTSATDSKGGPLDAAKLPYVVLPLPSSRWDSSAAGIKLGSVVLVLYQGKIEYGVFGDEGPPAIIGEASVAMADALGIDSNPATGGVDTGVTYVVFTGPTGVVKTMEDHNEAIAIGKQRLAQLLQEN